MPKIVSHAAEGTSAIEIDNYRQTVVVDPALAWWVSGSASADKGALTMHAPKIDQTIDFGPVSGSYKTTVDADGVGLDLGQRGDQRHHLQLLRRVRQRRRPPPPAGGWTRRPSVSAPTD